jgi:hypothetical protein
VGGSVVAGVCLAKNDQDFFAAWRKVNGSSAGIVTFYLLAQPALAAQSEPFGKRIALS